MMGTRVHAHVYDANDVEWEVRGLFWPGEYRPAPASYYTDPPEGARLEDVEARRLDAQGAEWEDAEEVLDTRTLARAEDLLHEHGMEGR